MFGAATLQLPEWTQNLSPFTHIPKAPGADVAASPSPFCSSSSSPLSSPASRRSVAATSRSRHDAAAPAAIYADRLRDSSDARIGPGWDADGKEATMVNLGQAVHERRAVMSLALRAMAFLVLAVWGVINLVEGDWVIGGLLVGCVVFGLPSLVSTVWRLRRHGDRLR